MSSINSSKLGGPSQVSGIQEVSKSFKVVSWKVAGMKGKLECSDWGPFRDQYDSCFFQDTWLTKEIWRPGYAVFIKAAIAGGRGRLSGGCPPG